MNVTAKVYKPQNDWYIRSAPAEVRIERQPALERVEYRPADLEIEFRAAKIEADWTQVWDDLGLKKPHRLMRERVDRLTREHQENVAHKAREGDRIGNLAGKERQVHRHLADEHFFRRIHVETNVDVIPKHLPDMQVTTYAPNIRIRPHRPVVDVNPHPLRIEIKRGGVDIHTVDRALDRYV